jgi:hypothetical protein
MRASSDQLVEWVVYEIKKHQKRGTSALFFLIFFFFLIGAIIEFNFLTLVVDDHSYFCCLTPRPVRCGSRVHVLCDDALPEAAELARSQRLHRRIQ